jgi:anthranilate/para-aminobenzoate synthase component II
MAKRHWSITRNQHLFEGLPNPFEAARYHYLAVELPQVMESDESAPSYTGEIMTVTRRLKSE